MPFPSPVYTLTLFKICYDFVTRASLVAQLVKNLPAMRETWVRSLGWEDPLEEGMATHFSIFAWTRMLAWDTLSSIKWTEEPSELEFMGSQRVGHN